MLIISNADVAKLLTMGEAIDALDQAYRQLVTTDAVCKPRTDIRSRPRSPARSISGAASKAARPAAISPSA